MHLKLAFNLKYEYVNMYLSSTDTDELRNNNLKYLIP